MLQGSKHIGHLGQPVPGKVHFLQLGQGPERVSPDVGNEIVRQIQMPETAQIRASKSTVCQVRDLIAVQLEPGQVPGVSEPGPSQGAEGVVAQRQHLQTAEPAEGLVGQRSAGDLVVLQQQRPQLREALQGVLLDVLDAVSAQGEQGQVEQEGQIGALYRGEGPIRADQNSGGHRGCCGGRKAQAREARYT